ncbi:DUF6246 family protein [Comamonas terrae]|uniref:DUF6246 family protein n=1 Tax=Comamonas terrae TaxID=673548 RepID=A0ABW5USF7_9BURK|nr:DUF6246 family protein [Comamonas terrae]
MLIEHGYSRVITADGLEFTFCPSFARIAALGRPGEILHTFKGLFGSDARLNARYVLVTLCEQEDATGLLGWLDADGNDHPGSMPAQEQICLAAHLLRHGMVGTVTKAEEGGRPVSEFNVAEYVAAARVHLQMNAEDAEALSMSEFQALFEMKFPDAKKKKRDVPTREEYRAALAAMS